MDILIKFTYIAIISTEIAKAATKGESLSLYWKLFYNTKIHFILYIITHGSDGTIGKVPMNSENAIDI